MALQRTLRFRWNFAHFSPTCSRKEWRRPTSCFGKLLTVVKETILLIQLKAVILREFLSVHTLLQGQPGESSWHSHHTRSTTLRISPIHYRSLVWSSPVMLPSHSRTGLGQTSCMPLSYLCLCDSIPPRLYPAFRLNLGSTACALSQSILSVWDTELTKKSPHAWSTIIELQTSPPVL